MPDYYNQVVDRIKQIENLTYSGPDQTKPNQIRHDFFNTELGIKITVAQYVGKPKSIFLDFSSLANFNVKNRKNYALIGRVMKAFRLVTQSKFDHVYLWCLGICDSASTINNNLAYAPLTEFAGD